MQPAHRVFISATSTDLSSCRQVVKEALLTNGILPIEQTNFPPDFRSVETMLEAKLRDCEAVICVVGFVYGAEPADRPADQPRRSYTQMEFDIARRLGKPVYQFLATHDCAFDAPSTEDTERKALQLVHRTAIESGRQLWERFSNHEQLRQRIAHIQFGKSVPGQLHPQNLPYVSLGKLFKGREAFLTTLREHLLVRAHQGNGAHAAAITQRQAVCGLGGVGKTRLAVEYGWRYNDEYCAVLFVVAESPENLRRNLARLTGPLVLNLQEQNRQEEEVKMAAAIRWLVEHPGWFLILDNVDSRPAAQAVEDLLARIPGGHILITSRLGDWSKDVEPLELDVLSSEDAKGFLLDRTQERRRTTPSDDSDAAILSRELDGLALALEQAGAFIERQRCSLADYLKRWKAGEARVRQWFDPRLMHYPRSVAITYDTTMREVGPAAAALFRLLSWFAADPLPLGVLETPKAADILIDAVQCEGTRFSQGFTEEAFAELAAFSMVKRTDIQGTPCFSQHRLVQELTQNQIQVEEQKQSLLRAISMLIAFAPKDAYRPEVWKEWGLLITHAEALWQRVKIFEQSLWDTSLMDGLALYYLGQGRDEEAIPIQSEVLHLKEARLGLDNRDTLLAKNDLALLLSNHGERNEALRLFREALAGRERICGVESEDTAETLFNIAVCLSSLEQLTEAEDLMTRALQVFRKSSGENHWRTLMTEKELARILNSNGKALESRLLLKTNVEKSKIHLPDSPDTALAFNDFALLLRKEGNAVEAEKYLRLALGIDERMRGVNSQKIPHRLMNLCTAIVMQGRLVEAKQHLIRGWQIKTGQHDLTSTRLLFVRLVVALLELQPAGQFVGYLKTVLSQEHLAALTGVARVWDIAYFIEFLRPKIGERHAEFLTALVAALNDRTKAPDLERFPEWQAQALVSLEVPWS